MMETLVPLAAIIFWTITFIQGQSYYHWTKENDEKKDFIEYPGVWLSRTSIEILKHVKGTTHSECLNICRKTPNCRAVDFNNEKRECFLLPVSTGKFETYDHTTFFSTEANQCSSYCDENDYMNICGQCQCVNLCNSISPFYCDCSEVIPASPMCTHVIKDADRNVSGIYKVEGTFPSPLKLMSQQTSEFPNGELWLTIFRRIGLNHNLERSLGSYRLGFSEPYEDKYFIGYNQLVKLTRGGSATLRVEMMSEEGQEFSIEYEAFVMTEKRDKKNKFKGYTISYRKSLTLTCVNDFHGETKDAEAKSCAYYYLIRNCGKKVNALGLRDRAYQRMTFLLSLGSTLRVHDNDVFTKQNGRFITPKSDSLNYCVQFEFQVTYFNSNNKGGVLYIPGIVKLQINRGKPIFYLGSSNTVQLKNESKIVLHHWYQVHCMRYQSPKDGLKTIIYLEGKIVEKSHKERNPVKLDKQIGVTYGFVSQVKGNLRNFYVKGEKIKLE